LTASILSLALAYVLLLLVLLLAVFKSDLGVVPKAVLVVLCSGFYLWHYQAMQAHRGWPASDDLPQNFELISRIVVEPDIKRDEDGGVYLWLRDLDREQILPRAYRLPYRKDLHRQVDDVQGRQQQGERFVGRPAAGSTGKRGDIEFEALERDREGLKPALE